MTTHLETHFPMLERVPHSRGQCVGAAEVSAKVVGDADDEIEAVREHYCLLFEGRYSGVIALLLVIWVMVEVVGGATRLSIFRGKLT